MTFLEFYDMIYGTQRGMGDQLDEMPTVVAVGDKQYDIEDIDCDGEKIVITVHTTSQ